MHGHQAKCTVTVGAINMETLALLLLLPSTVILFFCCFFLERVSALGLITMCEPSVWSQPASKSMPPFPRGGAGEVAADRTR